MGGDEYVGACEYIGVVIGWNVVEGMCTDGEWKLGDAGTVYVVTDWLEMGVPVYKPPVYMTPVDDGRGWSCWTEEG